MNRSYEEIVEALEQVDLLSPLPRERLEWLAPAADEIALETGELLAHNGEVGKHFFILLEGRIDFVLDVDGTPTLVNHHEPITYEGAMALITGEPSRVDARAARHSELLRFDEATLFELIREEPEILREIVRQVAPNLAKGEAVMRQREKLAALGSMSAGLAHEINNPAAAAARAADELRRVVDELRGGGPRLSGLEAEQLERLTSLACGATRATAGESSLAAGDREEALGEWLEERAVPEAWALAGDLADAGLDVTWAADVESAAGNERAAEVIPWTAAGAKAGGLLDDLGESLGRVSRLVGAIKEYSYMDQAPEQEVDVHQGLENTLTILGYKIKRESVSVQRDYDDSLGTITASGGELNQVWTNLIDNAVDATPGGQITISTRGDDDEVRVTVSDDGPGIPADVRQHLFEPFFTTKEVGRGTGIGLEVAWRVVVTNHHGALHVHSEPGDTRFEVVLPRSRAGVVSG